MTDVVARAERANQEVHRAAALRSGGLVTDLDGLCIIHGLSPSWVIANGAFRTDPALPADEALERTKASFRARARRPTLMTFERLDGDLDALLEKAGWTVAISLPIMVCSAPLPEASSTSGVTIHWSDPAETEDIAVVRDILRHGFADDEEERGVIDSLFATGKAIDGPDAAAVVVRVAGLPSATAMVYRCDSGGAVAWVATVPEARRQGLGRLVTTLVTNRGFALGTDLVSLQASPMGAPLYRAMGYETVTNSRVWIGPVGQNGG